MMLSNKLDCKKYLFIFYIRTFERNVFTVQNLDYFIYCISILNLPDTNIYMYYIIHFYNHL